MPSPGSATSPEDVQRTRLAMLVRIAAWAGDFSPKLAHAVGHATDAEVHVMADLVDRGLSIPGLVSLLQGAHVLVGDDALYERWIFPQSRRRLSSHHRQVDKHTWPDYGLDGPLVRESLHGKAVLGTWVQLERTRATFRWGTLPTWSDAVHIRDYVIYRITGKNVGPWGLSAHVDTRPVLLRPGARGGHGGSRREDHNPQAARRRCRRRGACGRPGGGAWGQAQRRYQLIMRVRRPEGVAIVVDSLVLRSGETRVDLLTRAGREDGYQRLAVDHASLESFLEELFALR